MPSPRSELVAPMRIPIRPEESGAAEESGAFLALNAVSGVPLWRFELNTKWHASPMTYAIDGKQYIAIAAGSNIVTFAVR